MSHRVLLPSILTAILLATSPIGSDLSKPADSGSLRRRPAVAELNSATADPHPSPVPGGERERLPATCGSWELHTDGDEVQALALEESTLWSGTTGGLVRWNLESSTHHKFTTLDGLSSNRITALVRDDAGILWVGTDAGLMAMDEGEWRYYDKTDGLPHNYVNDVAAARPATGDRAGAIWVGTSQGAARFDGERWESYTAANSGLLDDMVTGVAVDPNGTIWFDTDGGLSWLQGDEFQSFIVEGRNPDFASAMAGGQSGVWFGTSWGVERFSEEDWTSYTPGDGVASIYPNAIGANGNIWVGTDKGASVLQNGSWRTYTAANGLLEDRVDAVAVDGDGTAWLGTPRGISRFDGGNWESYVTNGGPLGNRINDVVRDQTAAHPATDAIWVGTDAGLSRFDGSRWVHEPFDGGPVTALTVDGAGTLWIGTQQGIWFRPIGDNRPHQLTGVPEAPVSALAVDEKGHLWIGTYRGVTRFNGEAARTYTQEDGLASSYVTDLVVTSDGAVWAGTDAGVTRWLEERWIPYDESDGLPDDFVRDLAVGRDGRVWAATDRGPAGFAGDGWRVRPTAAGLANERTTAVAVDGAGRVWVGTPTGVALLDGGPRDCPLPGSGANRVMSLSIADGELWAGTASGLYALHAPEIRPAPQREVPGVTLPSEAPGTGQSDRLTEEDIFIGTAVLLAFGAAVHFRSRLRTSASTSDRVLGGVALGVFGQGILTPNVLMQAGALLFLFGGLLVNDNDEEGRVAKIHLLALVTLLGLFLYRVGTLWAAALLYGAGTALFVASLQRGSARVTLPSRECGVESHRGISKYFVLLLFIILASFSLQAYGAARIPPGVHGDEAESALQAMRLLRGQSPLIGTGWYNQPIPGFGLQALSMRLLGGDVFGLRLASVLAGTLTLALTYTLAKRLSDRRTALIATALMGTSHWLIAFSRIGINYIQTPLLQLMAIYFLLRGLQSNRARDFTVSGAAVGAGLYVYYASRLVPFLIVAFLAFKMLSERSFLRKHWRGIAVLILAALVVFAPMGAYFLSHPQELSSRGRQVFIFTNPQRMHRVHGTTEPLKILRIQAMRVLLVFNQGGDRSGQYGYQGPMLSYLVGIFGVLGLGSSILRWRREEHFLLLVWFGATVIAGGILTIQAPFTPRLVGLIPAAFLFAGTALSATSRLTAEAWPIRWRPYSAPLLAVVLAIIAYRNYDVYFNQYIHSEQGWAMHEPTTDMARYLQTLEPDAQVYLLARGAQPQLYSNHGTLEFLVPEAKIKDAFEPVRYVPAPNQDRISYIAMPPNLGWLSQIRWVYPQGELSWHTEPHGDLRFAAYSVTTGD